MYAEIKDCLLSNICSFAAVYLLVPSSKIRFFNLVTTFKKGVNGGRSKIELECKKEKFNRVPYLNIMTERRFEMLKSQYRNSAEMSNQFQNILQYVGHFCTS